MVGKAGGGKWGGGGAKVNKSGHKWGDGQLILGRLSLIPITFTIVWTKIVVALYFSFEYVVGHNRFAILFCKFILVVHGYTNFGVLIKNGF